MIYVLFMQSSAMRVLHTGIVLLLVYLLPAIC